jgi:hypothetical protein
MPPTASVKPSRSATSSSESSAPDPAAFFPACSASPFVVLLPNSDGGGASVPALVDLDVGTVGPLTVDVSPDPGAGMAARPGVLPAAVAPIDGSGGAAAERGDVVVPVGVVVVAVGVTVGEVEEPVGGGLEGVVVGDAEVGAGGGLCHVREDGEPESGAGLLVSDSDGVVDRVVVGVRSAVTEGRGPGGRPCPGGGSDPGIGEPAGEVRVGVVLGVGVVVGDEVVDTVVVGDGVLVAGQFRLILSECTD